MLLSYPLIYLHSPLETISSMHLRLFLYLLSQFPLIYGGACHFLVVSHILKAGPLSLLDLKCIFTVCWTIYSSMFRNLWLQCIKMILIHFTLGTPPFLRMPIYTQKLNYSVLSFLLDCLWFHFWTLCSIPVIDLLFLFRSHCAVWLHSDFSRSYSHQRVSHGEKGMMGMPLHS